MSRLAWILFLFSGLTGLIYETLWTRRLSLVFGHSVLAVSTVVTAYMAGLALGSWLGGQRVDRQRAAISTPHWFLRAYGALEFGIGVWALLSLPLLDAVEWLYLRLAGRGLEGLPLYLALFAFSLLVLLPPTTAMGATLPIVSSLFVQSKESTGVKLSQLYALNTFGAVIGAALAGFVLLPVVGLHQALLGAAAVNLGIGALAWIARPELSSRFEPVGEDGAGPSGAPPGFLPLAFGLSGVASMAFQIGWTRGLSLCLGSSVYAFSAILVVFLTGIALGSAAYGRLLGGRRVSPNHLAALFVCLGLSGGVSALLLGKLPLAFLALFPYAGGKFANILLLDLCLCAVILLPPTLLMGLSFPLVTQLYHQHHGKLGPPSASFTPPIRRDVYWVAFSVALSRYRCWALRPQFKAQPQRTFSLRFSAVDTAPVQSVFCC